MELFWFAICTILVFTPWISAEEKLLYQTPTENRWGGWDVITNGLNSLNVIKLVCCCCCFTDPDYKHPICQRVAFLWCSGYSIVDPPSLSKDTRETGTFLKVQHIFSARMPVLFYTRLFPELLICICWAPYCFCLSVSD